MSHQELTRTVTFLVRTIKTTLYLGNSEHRRPMVAGLAFMDSLAF